MGPCRWLLAGWGRDAAGQVAENPGSGGHIDDAGVLHQLNAIFAAQGDLLATPGNEKDLSCLL